MFNSKLLLNGAAKKQLTISTALAGAILSSYGARKSYAGDCTVGAPGTYTCSGVVTGADTTQNLTGGPLIVTTTANFGITTAAGPAFSLVGTDGIDFDDSNASAISGATAGITASNTSSSLSITTTGDVVGGTGNGIYAFNSGTDLTIDAANVTGGFFGIRAVNYGSGAVSVTTTGDIVGLDRGGIRAFNSSFGTDLTIDAATVTGYRPGIYVQNLGSGALSITASGDVVGTTGDGVFAANSANSTDLTIDVAAVTGGLSGIYARNFGTGAVSVTASGDVMGTNVDGVRVINSVNSADLTINAAGVTGEHGVNARNYGTGAVSVTTSGDVVGTDYDGIRAYNSAIGSDLTIVANGAVSGDDSGIIVNDFGTGATSVTTYSTVNSTTDDGIDVYNGVAGTSLTIVANGDVNAELMGIRANNYGTGGVSITANGDVTGRTAHGIYGYNSANDVTSSMVITQAAGTTTTGATSGIYSLNYGGSLTINANGTTVGQTGDGIYAYNSGTDLTIDATAVTGNTNGIDARNYGSGTLSVTVRGNVQGGSGVGVQTVTNPGGSTVMVVENGATVGATSNEAISNNEGSIDLTLNSGSTVNGAVRLGNGSDVMTVASGANVSNAATVLDGGDDSSIADGFVDELYLNGTRTLAGANITNWESVVVAGGTLGFSDNALTVGADSGYGLMIQSGGTVAVGSNFALTGNLAIGAGGTFSTSGGGTGAFSASGDVANSGTLSLADGAAGDSFTVGGNYSGGGGLGLDADQATQTADTLIVAGDVTGATHITLDGFVSDGNPTDIQLVDVAGTSGSTAFTMNSIVDGAYSIGLEQDGNDWFLRNLNVFSPTTAIYQTYPQVLMAFSDLPSFYDRIGDPWAKSSGASTASNDIVSRNNLGGPIFDTGPDMWGYIDASRSHIESTSSSTTPTSYDLDLWNLRTGYRSEGIGYGNGQLVLGAAVHYGKANASISSAIGGGTVDTEALGLGVSATWIGDNGFYADGQLEGNSFSSDLSSNTLGSLVNNNSGHGYTASLEIGKRLFLDDVWSITPQAEITHSQVKFDSFVSSQGVTVSGQDGSATEARIGAVFDRQAIHTDGAESRFFGISNIYIDTASGTAVNVASTTFYDSLEKYSAEIGVGSSYSKNGGRTKLYGSITARTGLQDFGQSYAINTKVGLAFRF